ncbi:MAG: NifU family protein [Pseudomonadaceae bacterium]|nr:NifU family protein [Pseudomonadaceae bacterium]
MTIRTEATPNPNSLKYNVGRLLIAGGSANFPTAESAATRSPLARRVFGVEGVEGVFIGSDFFTVTRREGVTWGDINAQLAPALEAFFDAGEPVLVGKAPADAPLIGDTDADPATVEKIKQLLDEKVRPAVMQDGGDIVYRGFEKGVVYLEMHGACSNCPSSTATLKVGIETMLRKELPDVVQEVMAV